ncbi:hypothetical protein XU18_2131 [Perkinsela sp. CCAP 1560/4]|nr:hypothetical protein XU18_2131 [Perkinsela sp. CCAP 1560/4]|eukprot:KNH07155.1 hypothetical protein XU18_2131 [Perkinsela sp. CCAP 1560/4]
MKNALHKLGEGACQRHGPIGIHSAGGFSRLQDGNDCSAFPFPGDNAARERPVEGAEERNPGDFREVGERLVVDVVRPTCRGMAHASERDI